MPHWKTLLTYDGTPYNGWQIQPNLPTIQGTLAQAIHRVTGESVLPQGSGRTDTGVHALGQVATFTLTVPIPAANLHRALNRALPSSIRILTVESVPEDFHARHSARRKTYEYRIFPRTAGSTENICSPMLAPFVWDCPWPLDLAAMQSAASAILGQHDFSSFAASDPDLANRDPAPRDLAGRTQPDPRGNLRTVFHSDWTERDGLYIYRVTGTGFLHHMVRNLVGTFVDIGVHRTPADAVPSILAAQNRTEAGPTAPARGLFLTEVVYFW